MNVSVSKGKAKGTVSAPPSKSYSHRMMICAALSDGTSVLKGFSESQDMLATLDCVQELGAEYKVEGDVITIKGLFSNSANKGKPASLPAFKCRESGSTLRFMIPIALAVKECGEFFGTERLIERGIPVYEELFANKGVKIEKGTSSIKIDGKMRPETYELSGNVSSQFISGLMFALPLLEGDSLIRITTPIESGSYIQMTIDVLKTFGITIEKSGDREFLIKGNQKYQARKMDIEGDWSNAAPFFALGVDVTGLDYNSAQGDKVCVELIKSLRETPEKVIDISDCPDLGPILFAVAASENGGTFTGTARLRIKESDRANAMKDELAKYGIQVDVLDNSVIVHKGELKTPSEILSSHNDHRMVMSLCYLSSFTGGIIEQAESINKSFPDFFDKLRSLGLEINDAV